MTGTATQARTNDHAPVDSAEVARFLQLLRQPGDIVEVRILMSKTRTLSGYYGYDQLHKLAVDVAPYNGKYPIYVTLHQINPVLLNRYYNRLEDWAKHTTQDDQVLRYRRLFIDIDTGLPAGVSASEEEHETVRRGSEAICKFLGDRGLPDPVVVDSGNGYYVLPAIDLPNTPESRVLVDRCLAALDLYCSSEGAKIDLSGGNPSRICRLPGTQNAKGDDIPERPHRTAKVVSAPAKGGVVPVEALRALADLAPAPDRGGNSKGGTFDIDAWVEGHEQAGNLQVRSRGQWKDGSKYVLEVCAFEPGHTDGCAVITATSNGFGYRCQHNSCTGRDWKLLRAKLGDPPGFAGPSKSANDPKGATQKHGALCDEASIEKGRIRADSVAPRRLRPLWPGRLYLGKYGEIVGDGGLGKGVITADLVARVTRGWGMPDGSRSGLAGPRGAVWLQIEDTIDDTIVPRLLAAGADMKRVIIRKAVETPDGARAVDIQADLDIIKADCLAVDAALLVIDPVTYFLPDWADAHVDKSTRKALTPLVEQMQELDIVGLGIRHINKMPTGSASDRGTGSKAFTNLARFSLCVGKDPQDEAGKQRVMAVTKQNTGVEAKSLVYRIGDASTSEYEAGRIEWLGESDITADELLGTPSDRLTGHELSKVDEAMYFLGEALKDGGRKAKDVQDESKQLSISERTLDRAKTRAHIVTYRVGFGEQGVWYWKLPDPTEEAPKDATENDHRVPNNPKGANQKGGALWESGTLCDGDWVRCPADNRLCTACLLAADCMKAVAHA